MEVLGRLNLLMNLNRIPLIVLGFFNFHFLIDFIGVSIRVIKGVSRGLVGGQLTGGHCFVETPEKSSRSPTFSMFVFTLRDLIGCLNEPAGKLSFKMRSNCK